MSERIIYMAWRPNEYVINGELDNTVQNKITGFINFAGIGKVELNLKGNFHRDIRGAAIKFVGDGNNADIEEAKRYLNGFALKQTGDTGDITAGLPPQDYGDLPYFEWYGKKNGRVVIELEPEQVEVIGNPIPAIESDPIDRGKQENLMMNFMMGLAEAAGRTQKKKNSKGESI
jgi:hypothetical protein